MNTKPVTCSFSIGKDVCDAYRSIAGENVKGSIVVCKVLFNLGFRMLIQ